MGRSFLFGVLGEMNASCLLSMWKRNSSFCLFLSADGLELLLPGGQRPRASSPDGKCMKTSLNTKGGTRALQLFGSETQQLGSDLFCSVTH